MASPTCASDRSADVSSASALGARLGLVILVAIIPAWPCSSAAHAQAVAGAAYPGPAPGDLGGEQRILRNAEAAQRLPAAPALEVSHAPNAALPDVAGLFSSQAIDDNDPVEPFTLYGTVYKKFFIEKLEGERITGRKKGFTTTACTSAVAASKESPDFQRLTASEKALAGSKQRCIKAETSVRAQNFTFCPCQMQALLGNKNSQRALQLHAHWLPLLAACFQAHPWI
jgi:hypothetical protein